MILLNISINRGPKFFCIFKIRSIKLKNCCNLLIIVIDINLIFEEFKESEQGSHKILLKTAKNALNGIHKKFETTKFPLKTVEAKM